MKLLVKLPSLMTMLITSIQNFEASLLYFENQNENNYETHRKPRAKLKIRQQQELNV